MAGGQPAAAKAPRPAAGLGSVPCGRRPNPPRSPPAPSDEATKKLFAPGTFTEVPHDGMRKTIARRLVEAKSTIPHFYLTVDCELDALLTLREAVNASAPKDKDGKPSLQGLGQRFRHQGAGLALQRVPDANVTWTEGAMLKHTRSDIGVAVSIPGGLVTPGGALGRHQDPVGHLQRDEGFRRPGPGPASSSRRNTRAAPRRCRTSACIGIKNFEAVINPPQATILAVGAGEKRVVVKDGAPAVATVMSATHLVRSPRHRRGARRGADLRLQDA